MSVGSIISSARRIPGSRIWQFYVKFWPWLIACAWAFIWGMAAQGLDSWLAFSLTALVMVVVLFLTGVLDLVAAKRGWRYPTLPFRDFGRTGPWLIVLFFFFGVFGGAKYW